MKYCNNCNKEYGNEINTCPDCGTQLIEKACGFVDLDDNNTTTNPTATSEPAHQKSLPVTTNNNEISAQPNIQAQRPQFGSRVEKLGLISMLLLSLITAGIYGLYWITKLADIVHTLVGRRTTASGGKLIFYTIITFGIYGIVFYYNMTKSLNEAKDQRSMPGDRISAGTCIFFMLIPFLGLVSLHWIISAVNEIIDYDNLNEMISRRNAQM